MPRPLLNMFLIALSACLLICASLIPLARAEEQTQPDPMARFAFLVGTWHADHHGDFCEEIWSAPHSNAMMGMFRMIAPDGKTRLYEAMHIEHTPATGDLPASTVLRLRHFSSKFIAWEEKDKPLTLTLAPTTHHQDSLNDFLRFDNLDEDDDLESIIFSSREKDALTVTVVFRPGSGQQPLVFNFKRAE